jgi:hypothetical protein
MSRWSDGRGLRFRVTSLPMLLCDRRFKKLYEDYKPEFMYWKLTLMLRKFLFATVAVVLVHNTVFQVCGCFLVTSWGC